jgi:DNA-binding winged helix-turn-helix (wHTH) protein/Tol biopolymer transport system component
VTGHKCFVFRFGDIQVREREFLLVRAGEATAVEPKAFRVLLFLLRNPGRLVTKDEILEAVWNDCSVSDNSLTRSIATLRRLLNDDTREPRYIATVPTVGYRFLCAVEVREDGAGASVQSDSAERLTGAEVQLRSPQTPAASNGPILLESAGPPAQIRVSRSRGSVYGLAIAALVVAIALVIVVRLFRTKRVRPNHSVESRLTANPQDVPVTSSAISPDGKYLAFTDRTGFYLRQVEGGETHSLSLPEAVASARVESWFPDSMHLVISSWKGGPTDAQSLWKLSVMGGSPRKLVDDGEFARVSPDGSQIALMRIVDARPEIWAIRSDGEEARRLISGSVSEEEFFGPVAWSPDGKRIAFIRTTVHASGASERRLEIDGLQSGRLDVLLSNPNLMWLVAWPRETSLVYPLSEDAPNQKDMNLWEVQLDPRTATISGPALRVTSGRGWIVALSNTRDGKILPVRRVEAQPSVYIAELANGRKQILSPKRLTKENWVDTAFSWTADSKAVLLLSDRDGRQHIYKQALGEAQPELLVAGSHDYGLPRLDPTGHDLLYMQMPERGNPSQVVQIRRVSLAGGVSKLVLQAASIWNYQCARLPSTLCIYSSGGFANDLRFVSFDSVTGESAEILPTRMKNVENWSLSPDGKSLAVSRVKFGEDAAIQILATSHGSGKTVPLPGWSAVGGMDWAADGKSLWISACTRHSSPWGAPATCTLINVDLDGKILPLVEDRDVRLFAAIPSPDGQRLALVGEAADNANVWLVGNSQ